MQSNRRGPKIRLDESITCPILYEVHSKAPCRRMVAMQEFDAARPASPKLALYVGRTSYSSYMNRGYKPQVPPARGVQVRVEAPC